MENIFSCHNLTSLQWRGCLEIYSHSLLPHLFHFATIRMSDFSSFNKQFIRQNQTSTIFSHTDTPRARPKAASGIELTTPDSAQWAWQEGGNALILSAIGASSMCCILPWIKVVQWIRGGQIASGQDQNILENFSGTGSREEFILLAEIII